MDGRRECTRGGLEAGREGWMDGGREGETEEGREREEGREEGARGWWGREGSKGREVGSDDARQAESVSGGRVG